MTSYEFLTAWLLDAPREDVWDAIWDSASWPDWWHGVVEAVETEPGDEDGIGRRGRYGWRGRIPYRVRIEAVCTHVERPFALEGVASGDLEGVGRWRFFTDGGVTAAVYDWSVQTTKPWMNIAAPFAAPILRWNHDQVMRWGGEGLARHLGCRLLASS